MRFKSERFRGTTAKPGSTKNGRSIRSRRLRAQPQDGVPRYRTLEPRESKRPRRLDLQHTFRYRQHSLRDQNLSWLRFGTQARSQVRDRADRPVVPAPFEADRADRRVALRDADALIELVAELAPFVAQPGGALAHRQCHPHRPL